MNMLLLPGLLNGASLFEHQADALADVAGIWIADLSGCDSIAGLAERALTHAPEGRFVLVGMSMGGYVALEIMRQAPERVSALVLMSTCSGPDTQEATATRRQLIELGKSDFPAVIEKLLAHMTHPEHTNTPEVSGVFHSMATAMGYEVFVRQQNAIIGRPDSRPGLKAIACPTLVVCGREDRVTTLEEHQLLADAIAGARLEVIEVCGHLPPLERPEQVTEILREWLSGLGACSTEPEQRRA